MQKLKFMNSFTFIINYEQGTFISQIKNSISIEEATQKWFKKFVVDSNDIGIKEKVIKKIEKRLLQDNPVLIQGMDNVWCNDLGYISKKYFSMTIVGNTIVTKDNDDSSIDSELNKGEF